MDRTHNRNLPAWNCMQYKDYNWMMSFTEQLLEKICMAVNGTYETVVDGKTISFRKPFTYLPILEAIKERPVTTWKARAKDEIRSICKEVKMEIDDTMGKGKLIDEIFIEFCEGTFISRHSLSTIRLK